MDSVLLVDGNSLLRRAYHTPAFMAYEHNSLATGALYGFMLMLAKAMKKYKPTHAAVAFDAHRHCFRTDMYPEYKANREETPFDFIPQKDYAKDCLDAFGIVHYTMDGYEADDILATLARSMKHKVPDHVIRILTGDRDLLQVATLTAVEILLTVKGITDVHALKVDGIYEMFGVFPRQIPDYKALVGDPSDNIPGAKGIGKKTAVKLLAEYDTLELIIEQSKLNTKGKMWQCVRDATPRLPLYKDLATLRDGVPIEEKDLSLHLNLEKGYDRLLAGYGIRNIKF